MAKEYIEREKAIEWFMAFVHMGESDIPAETVISDLKYAIPAADVAEVRHGRWIEQEKYTFGVMYDCSICDNRILDTGHSWNYCPNCGAKMDGGAD